MKKDLITAITHQLAESFKEIKKLKKLLRLYKELAAIRNEMLYLYESPYINYNLENEETYLKIKIMELEKQ